MFSGLQLEVARRHGIGKKHLEILLKKFRENGGIITSEDEHVEHTRRLILTSNPQKYMESQQEESQGSGVNIVTADWISDSLEMGQRMPFPVNVPLPQKRPADTATTTATATAIDHESTAAVSPNNSQEPQSKKSKLVQKANRPAPRADLDQTPEKLQDEPNKKAILKEFGQLLKRYQAEGDWIRVKHYREALTTITLFPGEIESADELKDRSSIGGKTLVKIKEIISTGALRKNAFEPPGLKEIEMFQGIYNVGSKTAEDWYSKGYRNILEIQRDADKLKLTAPQRLGLLYYDDFQRRIPRPEIAEIGDRVVESLHRLDPSMDAMLLGSYRRGAPDSSDVDLLIYPRERGHVPEEDLILELADTLKLEGVIVSHLRISRKVYNGLCRLEKYADGPVRRIDFLLCADRRELGAHQLHFTGNELYNRNLRQIANDMGMVLSQHGLRYRATKDGEEEFVAGETEEEILERLGVEYLKPEDRNKG